MPASNRLKQGCYARSKHYNPRLRLKTAVPPLGGKDAPTEAIGIIPTRGTHPNLVISEIAKQAIQNVFEHRIRSEDMLITVSGPPGSGKSTTAAALAERFGLTHTSGGDIFRALADDKGISLEELNTRAEEDPAIDKQLDQRLQQTAIEQSELVLESRLAGWLAGDHATFRIWLTAPLDIRAERIADRENKPVQQALEETRRREASEKERYQEYYSIDIDDLSIYDICLNTARWGPADITEMLGKTIQRHDPEVDEGQVSVPEINITV